MTQTTDDVIYQQALTIERQHAKLATLCLYIHDTADGTDLPDDVVEIMNEMAELVEGAMSDEE